jgi:DNA-binding NtrC family response regulator
VQIRGNAMFLFVMRPVVVTVPGRGLGPPHAFGEPDADGIAGEGPATWTLRAAIASAVLADCHAFVAGESGTGKELVARAIHRQSGRGGMLIICNAATLVSTLAESLLFGNIANYPNPKTPERKGLVGEAHKGTLFIDEIGEMTKELQTRLLRALENRVTRLGETVERTVDVRFVGATNQDHGVVMRLDVFRRFPYVVYAPTLAQRIEDVPLIASALVQDIAKENPRLTAPFVTTDAAGASRRSRSGGPSRPRTETCRPSRRRSASAATSSASG